LHRAELRGDVNHAGRRKVGIQERVNQPERALVRLDRQRVALMEEVVVPERQFGLHLSLEGDRPVTLSSRATERLWDRPVAVETREVLDGRHQPLLHSKP
jgi:hypothetical protein